MESTDSSNWLTRIFPTRTNFFVLLTQQAQKVHEGTIALKAWVEEGALERCEQVREVERQADNIVWDLQTKLVDSFITPLDREDIYDLSAYLEEIINAAKTAVREIEALDISNEDYYLKELAATLVEGSRCLVKSLSMLESNIDSASEEANLARKSEIRASKIYQQSVRHLFSLDDFKQIQKTKEIYHCFVFIAEKIDQVAVKILRVVVKMP